MENSGDSSSEGSDEEISHPSDSGPSGVDILQRNHLTLESKISDVHYITADIEAEILKYLGIENRVSNFLLFHAINGIS